MLTAAEPHLERNVHPTVICRAFMRALDDAVEIIGSLAFNVDFNDRAELLKVVDSCIATKLTRRFGMLIPVRLASPLVPACECSCTCSTPCSAEPLASCVWRKLPSRCTACSAWHAPARNRAAVCPQESMAGGRVWAVCRSWRWTRCGR